MILVKGVFWFEIGFIHTCNLHYGRHSRLFRGKSSCHVYVNTFYRILAGWGLQWSRAFSKNVKPLGVLTLPKVSNLLAIPKWTNQAEWKKFHKPSVKITRWRKFEAMVRTALACSLGAATLKFRFTAVPGLIMFTFVTFEFKLLISI